MLSGQIRIINTFYYYTNDFHGFIETHCPFHTHVNTHSDSYCQHPPFAAGASVGGAVAVPEPPVSAPEAGSAAGLPNPPKSPTASKNRWKKTI